MPRPARSRHTYEAYIPGVDPPWEKGSPSKVDASASRTGPVVEHMKGNPKDMSKDREAVFTIRAIALRLVPIGGSLDVEELRVALRGQGIEWDDAVVAEAISVIQ